MYFILINYTFIMNKERLIERIGELKSDIQHIIDISKSKTLDVSLQQTKKEKLLQLKQYTEQLKAICKTDQKSQATITTLKKTFNENDAINFKIAKHKNSGELLSKVRIEKQVRKESMNKYVDFLQEQKFYNKFESDKIPSSLFLHESVINSYGLCPFIDTKEMIKEIINELVKENNNANDKDNNNCDDTCNNKLTQLSESEIEDYKQQIHDKRQSWLNSKEDSGKIYWDLYNKIYNKQELFNSFKRYESLEKQLDQFVISTLSDNQRIVYDSCLANIKEYINITQRNKTTKEKYKAIVNNLSILVSQLGYDLHNFLAIKFNTTIVINHLTSQIESSIQLQAVAEQFDKLLLQLKFVHEEIKCQEKFIANMKNNLQNEIYLYLTNQKTFGTIVPEQQKTQPFIQSKKYFKRWALLTDAEKIERFQSFSNFYIDKYLISTNIIRPNQRDTYLSTLIDLLTNAHKNKELIYRDLKWSNKDGIIEQVKCLRFNKETEQFFLNPSKRGNSGKPNNISLLRRKTSSKSIFTKETEKFINEEVLCHIVLFFQKYSDPTERNTHTKDNRESCIELIKNKLKIKKLTNDDKKEILKKYDDMLVVVSSNQ